VEDEAVLMVEQAVLTSGIILHGAQRSSKERALKESGEEE